MAKTHRRGTGYAVNTLKKRHKRPCASAPATPGNVTLTLVKRDVRRRAHWRARVKWDRVAEDVNGRPVNVEKYDVQLRATDASGNPLETDGGDNDFWRQQVPDEDGAATRAVFHPLPKPKVYYFQARVRTLNRVHGGRCWSGWSDWTTAVQASSGALEGPPAPDGIVLSFDRVEGAKGHPWRAKLRWNTLPTWDVPDGEPTEIDSYQIRLRVYRKDGTTLLNTRRGIVVTHDPDESLTRHDFGNIRGKRHYSASVRSFGLGRYGAWSSWTSIASPTGAPAPPTNVQCEEIAPRKVVVTWDPPTDLTDVDRYFIRIIRTGGGGTVVKEAYVAEGTHHFNWNVPRAEVQANPGANYRARVFSVEGPLSDEIDEDGGTEGDFDAEEASDFDESADQTVTEQWTADEIDVDTLPAPDPTDGDPPAESPTPVVIGGLGALFVRWPAIENADPVTYEVHISETPNFTPQED